MQGLVFSSSFTEQESKVLFLSLSLIPQFSFLKAVAERLLTTGSSVLELSFLLRLMRMECAHFLPTLLLMVLVSSQAHWE